MFHCVLQKKKKKKISITNYICDHDKIMFQKSTVSKQAHFFFFFFLKLCFPWGYWCERYEHAVKAWMHLRSTNCNHHRIIIDFIDCQVNLSSIMQKSYNDFVFMNVLRWTVFTAKGLKHEQGDVSVL